MASTPTTRTFETFEVRWERGSTWTGYRTRQEAEAQVAFALARTGSVGHVVRRTFEA